MIDILLEHPLTIGIMGAAACAVAGYVWLQTAHKAALYATAGFAVLTLSLIHI